MTVGGASLVRIVEDADAEDEEMIMAEARQMRRRREEAAAKKRRFFVRGGGGQREADACDAAMAGGTTLLVSLMKRSASADLFCAHFWGFTAFLSLFRLFLFFSILFCPFLSSFLTCQPYSGVVSRRVSVAAACRVRL